MERMVFLLCCLGTVVLHITWHLPLVMELTEVGCRALWPFGARLSVLGKRVQMLVEMLTGELYPGTVS